MSPSAEDLHPGARLQSNTVHTTLGIELIEATADRVELRMPVTERVHQPFGYLHGGVSVVLAESCASIGASIAAGPDMIVFGMEINANHLRAVTDGTVTCVGTPIHVGRSTHVWQMTVTDEQGRLICVSRCTVAARKHRE